MGCSAFSDALPTASTNDATAAGAVEIAVGVSYDPSVNVGGTSTSVFLASWKAWEGFELL